MVSSFMGFRRKVTQTRKARPHAQAPRDFQEVFLCHGRASSESGGMGKATKIRNCPAVGREIAAVECGRNRGVVYNCPAECPYCPWSPENYDDFLDIEERVDQETSVFYRSVAGSQNNIRNAIGGIMDGDGDEEKKEHRA